MKNILPTLILSTFLSFIFFPNQFLHPQNYLAGPADPLQITYELNQIQQNILTGKPLYYATFFAPYQNTLTYNDPLLASAILTLPLKIFHLTPLFYSNFAFIFFGLIATSLTTHILIFHLTKNKPVSIFGSLLFTFSGFHLSHYGHLNVFNLWLLPLSLYFFHLFLEKRHTKFLLLFLTTSSLQFLESFFSGYLIFFSCFFIWLTSPNRSKLLTPKNLLYLIPFIAICFYLTLPYLNLHLTLPEATRSIRESAHFSIGPEEILTKYSSLTIIFLLLLSLPVTSFVYRSISNEVRRRTNNPITSRLLPINKSYLLILIFSFFMSLGPVLKFNHETVKIFGHAIPLPYTLFYYLFPGFTGFRTPSRWVLLFSLSAVIIISQKLSLIFKNRQSPPSPQPKPHQKQPCHSERSEESHLLSSQPLSLSSRPDPDYPRREKWKDPFPRYILLAPLLLLTIIEAQPPLDSIYVDQKIPTVYEQVKNLPENSIILELPIRLSNSPDANIESLRSLYSLYHQHRRFNGLAGFAPNDWIDLVNQINSQVLTPEITKKLNQLGITHIVEENSLRPLTPIL
jgi:hypothetical protein